MASHPKEILTIDEVSVIKSASIINQTEDKSFRIYLEHWVDLKDLRVHGFDILLDAHCCDIHLFFECDSPILPELICQFLINMELKEEDTTLKCVQETVLEDLYYIG
ncbi:hypothetical protein LR48_Vigan10g193500 [Vigna angularis]|uniref:Uncharacterized protein n=1 Tax=Phaseolus angularis TaxID=3914 RepID=A0A0L9VM50_PHAAN|nr:hypothetical protein LR48_Vigan10g193500 [Vigna angularis]